MRLKNLLSLLLAHLGCVKGTNKKCQVRKTVDMSSGTNLCGPLAIKVGIMKIVLDSENWEKAVLIDISRFTAQSYPIFFLTFIGKLFPLFWNSNWSGLNWNCRGFHFTPNFHQSREWRICLLPASKGIFDGAYYTFLRHLFRCITPDLFKIWSINFYE